MIKKECFITDIFEKPIQVTNLYLAIKETKKLIGYSEKKEIFFEHITKKGTLKATGLEYYKDMLNKLNKIQENECN